MGVAGLARSFKAKLRMKPKELHLRYLHIAGEVERIKRSTELLCSEFLCYHPYCYRIVPEKAAPGELRGLMIEIVPRLTLPDPFNFPAVP